MMKWNIAELFEPAEASFFKVKAPLKVRELDRWIELEEGQKISQDRFDIKTRFENQETFAGEIDRQGWVVIFQRQLI